MQGDAAAPEIAEEKRALRKRMRALRLVVDQKDGPDASLALLRRCLPMLTDLGLVPGTVAAGYWPIGTELDIRPLLARLEAGGIPVCLPAIVPHRPTLVFRRWRSTDALEPAEHETQQPLNTAEEVEPQVILAPALAFDRRGRRLGQGAGWYDRTIAALRSHTRVTVIGVGYGIQLVDRVPADRHDQFLDWVMTDRVIERVS